MRHDTFLVTGGAGFIGSHVVDRLLAAGAAVTVVDDFNDYYDPALKRANVQAHLQHERYHLVEADIRDAARLAQVVAASAPACIVHLAARGGVRPSLRDPLLYETTNSLGTLNVLEAARSHGVARVICASSSSVYGDSPDVPFREGTALRPASPYGATKIAGEAMCEAYGSVFGLSIASLRFFTVYGPRQRPDMAIRLFAERMLAGEVIQLYGDGSTSRDYTFIDDILAGLFGAIELDGPGHSVYNLGNSSPVTLSALVEALERALGVPARIEWLPDQPGDVLTTYADVTSARERLGFQPNTPLDDGLAAFARWLHERR